MFSVIDKQQPIDTDNWAVSILRKEPKPDGSGNPEHAFLVVEGMGRNNKVTLWRYDLVMDGREDREGYAQIIIKMRPGLNESEVADVFQREFLRGDAVYAHTWRISKEKVKELHQAIQANVSKENTDEQLRYSLVGSHSVITSSDTGSSRRGHNCFTWARERLNNLGIERIEIPIVWRDYIGARTSVYLTPDNPESRSVNCLSM